jgi:hypothetical protein
MRNWDANVDIDDDRIIDTCDATILARNFGQKGF